MEEGRGMVVEQSVCVNETKRNGRGTGDGSGTECLCERDIEKWKREEG